MPRFERRISGGQRVVEDGTARAAGDTAALFAAIGAQQGRRAGELVTAQASDRAEADVADGGFRRRAPDSMASREYNRVGEEAFIVRASQDLGQRADELQQEFPEDQEAFGEAFDGFLAGSLEDADPSLRPEVRRRGEMEKRRRLVAIGQAAEKAQFARDTATLRDGLTSSLETGSRAARDGDLERLNLVADDLENLLGTMIEAGVIEEAAADGKLRAFQQTVLEETVIGAFDRYPGGKVAFLERFEADPEFLREEVLGDAEVELTTGQIDRVKARMVKEITAELAKTAKAAASRAADLESSLEAVEAGAPVTPELMARLASEAEALGPDHVEAFNAAAAQAERIAELGQRTPVEREMLLRMISATPAETPEQLERRSSLLAASAAAEKIWSEDPYAAAQRFGVIPPRPTLEPGEQMAARAQDWQAVREYVPEAAPVTKVEAAAIGRQLDSMTADERLQFVEQLVVGMGDPEVVRAVWAEVADSGDAPAVALAADLYSTGKQDVARGVMTGMEHLAADKTLRPKAEDWKTEFDAALGGALDLYPEYRKTINDVVLARYTDLSMRVGDRSGEVDPERLTAAVTDVTDGVLEVQPAATAPQSAILAPAPGVTADDFEDALEALEPDDLAAMGGVLGLEPAEALEQIRSFGALRSAGDGRYEITVGMQSLVAGDGERPFVLDWSAMQAAADRRRLREEEARLRREAFPTPNLTRDVPRALRAVGDAFRAAQQAEIDAMNAGMTPADLYTGALDLVRESVRGPDTAEASDAGQ
jgi:hypothetical protein